MRKIAFIICVLVLAACSESEQNKPTSEPVGQANIHYPLPSTQDSLFIMLNQCQEDSNSVNILNQIAISFFNISLDSSLKYDNLALQIAKKIKWKRGIAATYGDLGVFYIWKSDYNKALDCYKKAVQLDIENKALKQLAVHLGNIGTIYDNLSDYPKSLEYHFKSLKISEELNQLYGKKNGNYGMQRQNANIGIIYSKQGDYTKALNYYNKALGIAKELADSTAIAVNLGNIGTAYMRKKEPNNALGYYLQSLKIDEARGNRLGIARNLGNIGSVYSELGKSIASNRKLSDSLFQKALSYFTRSLQYDYEIDNKIEVATCLGNIGALNNEMRNYKVAHQFLFRALAMNDSMRTLSGVKENCIALSLLYSKSNIALPDSIGEKALSKEKMSLLALHFYKRFISVRDTIFSQENSKKIMRSEMNFEFEKQKAVAAAKHKSDLEKQTAVAAEKERKQKVIMFSVVSCLLLVGAFAAFVFRSLRITRKQKLLIDLKNAETERQKHLIEEKQKEIIDSITYASRIQRALLPNEKYIERVLKIRK